MKNAIEKIEIVLGHLHQQNACIRNSTECTPLTATRIEDERVLTEALAELRQDAATHEGQR